MMEMQIAIFLIICAALVAIGTSILCRVTPPKPAKKQSDNTLPLLPIIDNRYQIQQPVNGYQQPVNQYQQQPVNYQPIQQAAPQLDAFTVNYMLQLIANQRRE